MHLKQYFQFKERNTNYTTEIIAGITTFLTMAYIIILNPSVLSKTGMDFDGVFFATIIASVVGCLFMGIFANYPIAIAPSLATNAYFAFVVVISMGIPWQEALGAVFISALIFLLLSLTSFRQAVINSIPSSMKEGISAGIGLFISFVGLQNAHIIVASPSTLVTLGNLTDPITYMSLLGIFISVVLIINNVRGALFLGMIIISIISFFFGYISLPDTIFNTPEFGNTFMQMDVIGAISHNLFTIIFTFFIVTLFDTTGTMLGIAKQAGLMKNNTFPNVQSAFLADSIASLVGAIFGTSPTSPYVESSSGVASGGRTGFSNIIVALLFILMLFAAPIAKVLAEVPAVTAPALIIVGFYMMSSLSRIDWNDMQEAFPAFLIFLLMPLSYSITDAVGIGIITYCLIKIFCGKFKQVHPLLYAFMLLFIIQFVAIQI
ncbi:Guanine/hypoxanthine permease PbuO [Megamonas hypermegale]|uniref:Guanine/hypoxanthine permease PbuO n=1 Tax=Megamonas hypermegale TaxID=158847 RepID=A0A239TTY0_9FIRM|nr:NCS2 family permease [Megamonas hypermegale]SNV01260.1 Guanine/hypoxanthine permease PbuO [Megamonas hypermegale]